MPEERLGGVLSQISPGMGKRSKSEKAVGAAAGTKQQRRRQ
jgi:hypothetical protein